MMDHRGVQSFLCLGFSHASLGSVSEDAGEVIICHTHGPFFFEAPVLDPLLKECKRTMVSQRPFLCKAPFLEHVLEELNKEDGTPKRVPEKRKAQIDTCFSYCKKSGLGSFVYGYLHLMFLLQLP